MRRGLEQTENKERTIISRGNEIGQGDQALRIMQTMAKKGEASQVRRGKAEREAPTDRRRGRVQSIGRGQNVPNDEKFGQGGRSGYTAASVSARGNHFRAPAYWSAKKKFFPHGEERKSKGDRIGNIPALGPDEKGGSLYLATKSPK